MNYAELVRQTVEEQGRVFFNDTVLARAGRLVNGDRQATYGHPAEDFGRTAGLWRALFGWEVSAKDVALAMACVKLSRLRATPDHMDSLVDLAGYAETYRMVLEAPEP